MTVHPDIEKFVTDLEIFAKRKLNYPTEVGELLQIVVQTGLAVEFEELIFHAKSIIRMQDVMNRIGPNGDGFGKLSKEFQFAVQKAQEILKILFSTASDEINERLSNTFITLDTKSIHSFNKLLSDLSWIKNWQVDGKPLPYEKAPSVNSIAQEEVILKSSVIELDEKPGIQFSRIIRSTIIVLLLFILFLLIDPPVTVIGWILSLGIVLLVAYIILQIHLLKRTTNS